MSNALPKIRAVAKIGPARVFLRSRGDVQLLKLLIEARGDWVTPQGAGIKGQTLSRHAAELRRHFSLPVITETIPEGKRFHNRHRLAGEVSLSTTDSATLGGFHDR